MSQSRYLSGVSLALFFVFLAPIPGRAASKASLTGLVSSQQEGPMEGVLVSAKGAGTNITVTVVTDNKGRYSFPKDRLKPNNYLVSVRAVGYEISSPNAVPSMAKLPTAFVADKHTIPLALPVEVKANKTAELDLKLDKAPDLASQLTKVEWLLSFPGTDDQKKMVGGTGCGFCHSLERFVKSKYDEAEFLDVAKRMANYAEGSWPGRPVPWPQNFARFNLGGAPNTEFNNARAQYLATINLSGGRTTWNYQLKTLPRPKGEATKVIYTEYDLPNPETAPHDAVPAPDGMLWFSDYASLHIGRLNPKTGEVKEWALPVLKPQAPATGLLSLNFDNEGRVWVGTLYQAAVFKFDPKTEKWDHWNAPGEYNNNGSRNSMTAPRHSYIDGKVWFDNAQQNQQIHRIDLATNEVETIHPYGVGPGTKGHSLYGIDTDSKNNLIFDDYVGSRIGIIDAKTKEISLYPTPTPAARPRRLSIDSQDRVWFGENAANRIGMFDFKTKQMKEWEVPTPWSDPYDVMLDKNGQAWTAGMTADRVVRLYPDTGKMIEYLLPRATQTRRVYVDSNTTPVTFWVGNNMGNSIVKLEPLE